jgi:hypothetical protein
VSRGVIERDGDTEVGQPQEGRPGAGRLEQQVGRLDVAVHEPSRVHGGQRVQQLVDQDQRHRQRYRPVVGEQRRDGAARHQVHREQDVVVLGRPAVRGDHVRVGHPHRLLTHEAQQRRGVALAQQLGRDVPAGLGVPGPPDRAAATLTQVVDQLVAAGEPLSHTAKG